MIPRVLVLVACLTLLVACPAVAEELGGWISREDAAKAAGAGAEAKALKEETAALKAEAAELRMGRDAALKLVETLEKLEATQTRLIQLAEEERDAYKEKAERLEGERGKGRLWLLVQARGAMGALVGAPFGGPVGAGIGALAGVVTGLIEALVSP